jgi:acyl-CoA thioester hydrolase
MGVAHHSAYTVWLEIARTELLRARGIAYRELEAQGVFFVVARLSIRYRRPARYDERIEVNCSVAETAGVKIEHAYELRRGSQLLATAETTIVCVDREGRLQPVPEPLR